MRICWRRGRSTVREVLQDSLRNTVRDYRTVLTLLTRVANKGYLKVEKEGKTNYYTPAVPQQRALTGEIRRFLKEVVGPERENRELLRKLLDDKKGTTGGRRKASRRRA